MDFDHPSASKIAHTALGGSEKIFGLLKQRKTIKKPTRISSPAQLLADWLGN